MEHEFPSQGCWRTCSNQRCWNSESRCWRAHFSTKDCCSGYLSLEPTTIPKQSVELAATGWMLTNLYRARVTVVTWLGPQRTGTGVSNEGNEDTSWSWQELMREAVFWPSSGFHFCFLCGRNQSQHSWSRLMAGSLLSEAPGWQSPCWAGTQP